MRGFGTSARSSPGYLMTLLFDVEQLNYTFMDPSYAKMAAFIPKLKNLVSQTRLRSILNSNKRIIQSTFSVHIFLKIATAPNLDDIGCFSHQGRVVRKRRVNTKSRIKS